MLRVFPRFLPRTRKRFLCLMFHSHHFPSLITSSRPFSNGTYEHPEIEKARVFWDLTVKWYDKQHGYVDPVTSALLYHLKLDEPKPHSTDPKPIPKKLLDIAVGNGRSSLQIVRALPPRSKYYGIDLSPGMVRACRRVFDEEKVSLDLDVCAVHACDAQDMSFILGYSHDGTFDRIHCGLGLMDAPDPTKVINEIWRLLRPGGIGCFSVWGKIQGDGGSMPAMVEQAFKPLLTEEDDENPFELGEDDDRLRNMFLRRGFSECFRFTTTTACPFHSKEEFAENFTIFPFGHKLMDECSSDEERDEMRDRIDSNLQLVSERMMDEGRLPTLNLLCCVVVK